MTAARAIRLDTEGNGQHSQGTSRHLQHGCCRDQESGGGRALVGLARDGSASALVFQLKCRSVNRCRCCAADKLRRDRARAFMGAALKGRVVLVTLTIDPNDLRFLDPANRRGKARPPTADLLNDPRRRVIEESLRYQSWAWNRLRTALSRTVAFKGAAYFRGVELQRSGMAHLHVIVRVADLASFWSLRAALRGTDGTDGLAVRAGFGRVSDVQLARSRGDVARYVTKDVAAYATKGTDAVMPRYTRRTGYSLGTGSRIAAWAPDWARPTRIAGFTWRLAAAGADTVTRALVASDFVIGDPERFRVRSGGVRDGAASFSPGV